jgi:hypothetical protein
MVRIASPGSEGHSTSKNNCGTQRKRKNKEKKRKMETITWEPTKVEVDTVSWDEKALHLKDVPALKDPRTGKVWIRPAEVAKAEIAALAKEHDLEPRDIALLLALKAQPGGFFNKEEVQFQYHLNKILFYQWKGMERLGLGEAFPHDKFIPADRGPVPENITDDIQRLERKGFITTELRKWGSRKTDESRRISLSKKGSEIAHSLVSRTPAPLRSKTSEAKTLIFPLPPAAVREMVHKEYREYRKTYTQEDLD